jgi:hypothetical protein
MTDTAEIREYPGCPACWGSIIELCDEIDRLRAKLDAVRQVHALTQYRDPHMDDCATCSCCGFGIGACTTRRAIDD